MSKAAFVILAPGDNLKSLGRVINALMVAYEVMKSGREVKIIFDGEAGTPAMRTTALGLERLKQSPSQLGFPNPEGVRPVEITDL